MDAVINLNKPRSISSHRAVADVKRALGARKAGHAGTLDPLATGVLLVCLNEATKITRFLSDADKAYRVRIKLGERTDTYDAEGTVVERKDISHVRERMIERAVSAMEGRIRQRPPMYSAIKISGTPLYKLARKGIEVERPDRDVVVYRAAVESVDLPFADLLFVCSKGTYIRSLCDDIGSVLETGAHIVALERTRVGHFDLSDSLSPADLSEGVAFYHSMDDALREYDDVVLDGIRYERARNGGPVSLPEPLKSRLSGFIRLKDPEGKLFAVGRVKEGSILIERMLNTGGTVANLKLNSKK